MQFTGGGGVRQIPCRLHEVEEIIEKIDLFYVADDIMESEDDYQIVISGWWVHIPELNINLHEGVFCNYDEDEKEYLPDFSLTVIMEADTEKKENEWLYYEQDGFEVTLANYQRGNLNMEAISELSCLICIPDDEPDTE